MLGGGGGEGETKNLKVGPIDGNVKIRIPIIKGIILLGGWCKCVVDDYRLVVVLTTDTISFRLDVGTGSGEWGRLRFRRIADSKTRGVQGSWFLEGGQLSFC